MGVYRTFGLGFFKDVADALVGSGKGRAFGQGGKGTHGRELFFDQRQTLRAQGQHGVHLLGAEALLTQAAGEAVVDEVGE
ncbi:hypothetical protein D3C71_1535540 [compost metagenome]